MINISIYSLINLYHILYISNILSHVKTLMTQINKIMYIAFLITIQYNKVNILLHFFLSFSSEYYWNVIYLNIQNKCEFIYLLHYIKICIKHIKNMSINQAGNFNKKNRNETLFPQYVLEYYIFCYIFNVLKPHLSKLWITLKSSHKLIRIISIYFNI